MHNVTVNSRNLEIAIQTVLHRYHSELGYAEKDQQEQLIREMAYEITRKAQLFEQCTEDMMHKLGAHEDEL